MSEKKTLLLIYFSASPSNHALGPAVTIDSFIAAMGGIVDIELITLNMDYSARRRHFDNPVETANRGGYRATYLTPGLPALRYLFRRLRRRDCIVLVNCLYDYRLAIPALLFSLLYPPQLLVHLPHGIFMDIIQSQRRARKYVLNRFLATGFVSRRLMHVVSSDKEREDANRVLGREIHTIVIPHFTLPASDASRDRARKRANSLRIVLVGRIAEQKNIVYALERIAEAGVACTLDVFGEIADPEYMRRCSQAMESGGLISRVKFCGRRDQAELLRDLGAYDLMFLPTKGENFGHAIIEAMSAGLPVLISDLTPWSDVAGYGAGWAVPLTEPQEFSAKIRSAYEAGEDWSSKRENAVRYVETKIRSEGIRCDWMNLINEGIAAAAGAPNEGGQRRRE